MWKMFNFTVPFVLWAYLLSSFYPRWVTPFLDGLRRSLDDENLPTAGILSAGMVRHLMDIVLMVAQTYGLTLWSAWTVLRIRTYTHMPDAGGPFIYYIIGLGCCEWALARIAQNETYQGILSILHDVIAMGGCLTFAIMPPTLMGPYTWLVSLMGGLH